MSFDSPFCEMVRQIQQDPTKQVKDLTVGLLLGLKEHVRECDVCSNILDSVLETTKDIPEDPNSEWSKTQYN